MQEEKNLSLYQLFIEFFKIGITTFGGGLAMIANINSILVEKKKWLSENEFYDFIAIAQCTPGIIMVNVATLLGAKKRGIIGSIVATFAVVFPSLIIISLIAYLLLTVPLDMASVEKFLQGIRVAVCAISLKSLLKMIKANIKSVDAILVFVILLALKFIFNLSSEFVILLSIVCGLLLNKSKD